MGQGHVIASLSMKRYGLSLRLDYSEHLWTITVFGRDENGNPCQLEDEQPDDANQPEQGILDAIAAFLQKMHPEEI